MTARLKNDPNAGTDPVDAIADCELLLALMQYHMNQTLSAALRNAGHDAGHDRPGARR